MKPFAYYNEINPQKAACLRELIKRNLIAPGEVDERSIKDVQPDDLRPYRQCHFFAGVAVWSYALRLAGWPDDRGVWTGSCPCQPFSISGKKKGIGDDRHLWPEWFRLISARQPISVFGEQVAPKDGLAWLDIVQSDLEAQDYAVWPFDLCAAGFGAPHVRQRLYIAATPQRMAHAQYVKRRPEYKIDSNPHGRHGSGRSGNSRQLGNPFSQRLEGREGQPENNGQEWPSAERAGGESGGRPAGPVNGFWRDADWIFCRDGKWRPIESGTSALVNGAPARVGRIHGYGDAIVAEAAKEFIQAYREIME